MFYNLYRFPAQPPANRENILKDILDTYHPDILMSCELVNEDGAERILNHSLNYNGVSRYARAGFIFTHGDTADPLQQMVFYNKEKLILLRQQVYPTKVRDINHYTFLLNTTGDSIHLDVFVTHLKSSEGAGNRQLRLEMIDTFVKKSEAVTPNHYVLLAGDFNFYSSYNEPAYQKILDTNNHIRMVDPIHMPGNWNGNDSFKAIHTQATRLSSAGFGEGGASGGMDDRFDFIMMSKSLEQQGALSYVDGSYKAYGNNGNCFDNRIDAYDCDGPYSLQLRQNLYNMSDHIPVVMQLKVNREFAVGVNEVSTSDNPFHLNGNVVKDFLEIKMNSNKKIRKEDFAIYNIIGQKMNVDIQHRGDRLTIDMRMLQNGMYYLACLKGGRFKILKY
ncbi:hypothetical protein F0919_14010 [Taibaiella lutea]|uniref:Endonuclease/exonuclease/phosphatase domain-containing protein n=1 Tax=Taibaiella lutea TaxID=2608001 RepID=A0A5M6CF22_9BACT|nr:hypothetical protein [Taibaiella lutea]KAA5533647.1 hypothetical protein F0919_14010 [Taibaiella lutea]